MVSIGLKSQVILLFLLMIILQELDVISTYLFVNLGKSTEGNIFLAEMINNNQWFIPLVVKIIPLLMFGIGISLIFKLDNELLLKLYKFVFMIINFIYTVIVAINFIILF